MAREQDESGPVGFPSGDTWSSLVPEVEPEKPSPAEDAVRYERRGMLGQGGMGRVYTAEDRRLRREVALKEANDPELARRMAQEAWITAQLEHPNIVPIYDAGNTDDGNPFYTMRLIRGRTLADAVRESTTIEGRLLLLRHYLDACQAMAYAHALGVVHRDLKPSNILVGEFGETYVADWGLAQTMEAHQARWARLPVGDAGCTAAGSVVGTPAYMAPEQARGETVDARADVWSLGMVLYELLAGAPAFTRQSAEQTLERVRRGEVPDLAEHAPFAPAELQSVVARACRADAEARYPSAAALAVDLERYLDGRTVLAHEYTPTQMFTRLVAAWRAPLWVGGLAVVLLLALGVASGVRVARERDVAQAALAEADRNLADALSAQAVEALRVDARPEAETLAAHALSHGERPAARGVLAAYGRVARPRLVSSVELPASCREGYVRPTPDVGALLCSRGGQLEVWDTEPLQQRWSRALPVEQAVWMPNEHVAVVTLNGHWVLLDGVTGAERVRLPASAGGKLVPVNDDVVMMVADKFRYRVTWSTGEAIYLPEEPRCPLDHAPYPVEGRLLGPCRDGGLRWLDASGQVVGEVVDLPEAGPFGGGDVHDGVLTVASLRGIAYRVDLRTNAVLSRLEVPLGDAINAVAIPGTEHALVIGGSGRARVWHSRHGSEGSLPAGAMRIASGEKPGVAWVFGERMERWTLPVDSPPHRIPIGPGISSVRIDPAGELLAVADGRGRVSVWGAQDGRLRWEYRNGEPGVAKAATFSVDGQLIASSTMRGGVQLFDRDGGLRTVSGLRAMRRIAALADGRFVGLPYGRTIQAFRPDEHVGPAGPGDFVDAAESPSRAWMVLIDRTWQVCRMGADEEVPSCLFTRPDVFAADISDDGETVWLGRFEQVCRTDLAGQELACGEVGRLVLDVEVSPDRRWVVAGLLSGDVAVLDATTLEVVAVLRGHSDRVASVDWAPDGTWLVTASWDGTLRLWDAQVLNEGYAALIARIEPAWEMDLERALRR